MVCNYVSLTLSMGMNKYLHASLNIYGRSLGNENIYPHIYFLLNYKDIYILNDFKE